MLPLAELLAPCGLELSDKPQVSFEAEPRQGVGQSLDPRRESSRACVGIGTFEGEDGELQGGAASSGMGGGWSPVSRGS
jgi:hypothetical protein